MNNQFENMETQDLNTNNKLGSIDSLVVNLKKEDLWNLNLMKSFKWIYLVMIIAYTLLMVVNPDSDLKLHNRISGICYVVAFGIFVLIFRKYHKEYSEIDYTLPVAEMLSKAAKRYKFRWKSVLITLPSLVLIDVGVVLSSFYDVQEIAWNRVIYFQIFYFTLMGVSGFVGYMIWKKKQKPLYEGAMQLLKELEGN